MYAKHTRGAKTPYRLTSPHYDNCLGNDPK
jgi:hypothetical protein